MPAVMAAAVVSSIDGPVIRWARHDTRGVPGGAVWLHGSSVRTGRHQAIGVLAGHREPRRTSGRRQAAAVCGSAVGVSGRPAGAYGPGRRSRWVTGQVLPGRPIACGAGYGLVAATGVAGSWRF